MKLHKIAAACALAAASTRDLRAQTRIDLHSQAQNVDFSDATSTKPSKIGTTLPSNCSVGETFVKTDAVPGTNFYVCTAANVWTAQSAALPAYEAGSYGKVLTNDAEGMQWQGFDGDVSGDVDALRVNRLQGRPLAQAPPANGDFLGWDGTQWLPRPGATIPSIQTNKPWLCDSTTGTASYVCSLTAASALTAYTPGMWLTLLADTTNTGAATLNVDGMGARPIRRSDGISDPVPGQITAGRAITITYDGNGWRLPPYSGVPFTAPANHFVTALDAAGVATTSQPSFAGLAGSLAGSQMPALTGDVTTSAGSVATSLASVNAAPGQCGDETHVCRVTTNVKGLITQQSAVPITVTGGIGSLNGLSGANQVFVNDSNVTLSSAGATHTLGWSGLLSLSRGGVNADLSGTGGTHQVLRQSAPGAAVSVGQLNGGDIAGLAASAIIDTTNAANITSGTLPAARLPSPGASALGGVQSKAAQSHFFLTAISNTDGSVSAAQPLAADVGGLAASATIDTTNASNISGGTLALARIPTGTTSSTVAIGNHAHSGVETTANKDTNGGYVGRDSSGNAALPGSVTAASFASSDTTHTGKIELTPGLSTNFANSIASGNYGLFLDSANSNKLTRRDSSGNNTVIEGGGGGGTPVNVNGSLVSTPNFNGMTPAAQAGYVNATFQVSSSNVSVEVPTGTTSSTVAIGNHAHTGFEATTNKDVNGGYVGRDSSGNAALPGSVTAASFASTDTTHTGKIELAPGLSTNFGNNIASGNYGLFLDAANGNKLTRRDASGNNTVVEGGGGGTTVNVNGSAVSNPNFNGTTPAAQTGYVNATFQVSSSSVSAEVPTGTTSGTLAAGNDPRITGAIQSSVVNAANGVAGLDAASRLALAQLPQDFTCSAGSGSGTAYTCSFPAPPASLVAGERYWFKADVSNTGTATVNFNSLGAKTIKKVQGGVTTDIVANDIQAGAWVGLVYDGTNFQMVSQLGNAASGSGANANGNYLVTQSANAPANAVNLGALSTGILKCTVSGGICTPAVASAGDFPTLNQNTTGTAAGLASAYLDWNAASGGASILNKPALATVATSGSASDLSAGTLSKVRGGAGADMSSVTFPSAGTLMTTSMGVSGSQMPALTGDVTTTAGQVATTIAAGAVTPGKSSAALKTDTWSFNIGADNAAADLADADMGPQGNIFKVPAACTVSEVAVSANAGTPKVPILQKNHWGGSSWSATDITSAALATGAAGIETCAATGSDCISGVAKDGTVTINTAGSANVLAAGDYIQTKTGSGFASTGAKRLTVSVTCVRN